MTPCETSGDETDSGEGHDEHRTESDEDPHAQRILKDWLLAPEARTENLTPPREAPRMRPPPCFD